MVTQPHETRRKQGFRRQLREPTPSCETLQVESKETIGAQPGGHAPMDGGGPGGGSWVATPLVPNAPPVPPSLCERCDT